MTSSEWFGPQPSSGARPDDTVILNETPDGTVATPDGADATVALPTSSETVIIPPPRPVPPQEKIETPPPPPRKRRRRPVAVAVVALLGAGAAGSAAYATTGDIPRGVEVLGLSLGALTLAEAEKALREHVATRSAQPARVRLDGQDVTVTPASVDLTFDVPATVDAAATSGIRLFGTKTIPPAVRVDETKLETALRKQLDPERVTVLRPAIAFRGVTPVARYAKAGVDLDRALAAERVKAAWPTGGVADVPLTERTPVMTDEQVDALVEGVAKPAVAAPVTVTVGGESIELGPAAIAKGLVFRPDGQGRLSPAIDAKRLRAAGATAFGPVETPAEPATVRLRNGRPQVVPGTPGRLVDVAKLGPELLEVLPATGPRKVTGVLAAAEPETSAADVTKLGIKQKVSTFTTYFTGGRNAPRSQNIITIAKAVDGAVVQPGATFSLNRHTGERTYAKGYKDAPVIVGGVLEPGVGGGASQFTTTLFNAAYYAGLQDVEHKPHSFYFSRYPSVIEATIFYPTLDLKFKNTTPYGILIDTATTGRSVTVTLWSTKVYDSVKTVYGPRRNQTSPPTVRREAGPKCISTSGLPGFTQDAWRVIRKDGQEVERKKFTWRYDPEPRFVCGGTE
ncbi:vanomycin resistance protein VanB [Paractinoplanes abujensis]|uniref:Vancomycin resistance protein YoaR n=1 Tax=Paractinoplanes abujensis TaxID=882441 RepID=A0A7W7CY86_9ACTN|nr:VanW family protein [Actinoplanes abujensis]MBB4696857.1 vancomycin resistance protein YoaR [Actinoplanes abujensis]GID18676.1 vanomycin resistance protein VanB [Actinoplanes abujensis]